MRKTPALGRRKKTPDEAQNTCVSVWLTPDEKSDIAKAAAVIEIPVSTWSRRVLKDAARKALEAVGM